MRRASNSTKAIFMHIHRCAGTSVYSALMNERDALCCVSRPGSFGGRMGRNRVPDNVWKRTFKFTFVRNPWDRAVSLWRMAQRCRNLFLPSFESFVLFLARSDLDTNAYMDEFAGVPFEDMDAGMVLHHASAYGNPKYHLDEMDFIGRFENLQADFDEACDRAGIPRRELPRLNATEHADYREHYDDNLRVVVGEAYREDIRRFGYEF